MTHYYELRTTPQSPANNIAADVTRHMNVRQYLGATVLVVDNPISMLSVVRKHWMHLARNLQKQRASTLNAEEILRLTHGIMHMHHMQFIAKPPQEAPDAQVFFVTPEELSVLPPSCFTLYLLAPIDVQLLAQLVSGLPDKALVVNYDVGVSLSKLGLKPKSQLESQVLGEWRKLDALLSRLHIQPTELASSSPQSIAAADEALDTLMGVSGEFLHLATGFQHAIHLAQPLSTISAEQQKVFTAVARLAHRVQALSPSTFSNYLIKNFGAQNDRDIFFLHDPAADQEWSDSPAPPAPALSLPQLALQIT